LAARLSIRAAVVFHEEYARAGGPGRMGHIGEGLIGPTLIRLRQRSAEATLPAGHRRRHRILGARLLRARRRLRPRQRADRCWQEADGSWRVQGQKVWTSLALESEWIFVLARSEPGRQGP